MAGEDSTVPAAAIRCGNSTQMQSLSSVSVKMTELARSYVMVQRGAKERDGSRKVRRHDLKKVAFIHLGKSRRERIVTLMDCLEQRIPS